MSISIATLGKFSPPGTGSSGGSGGYVPYPVEIKKDDILITADFIKVSTEPCSSVINIDLHSITHKKKNTLFKVDHVRKLRN